MLFSFKVAKPESLKMMMTTTMMMMMMIIKPYDDEKLLAPVDTSVASYTLPTY